MSYREFVANKLQFIAPSGMDEVPELHSSLYPHQRDLVAWALRRGRCAIFADTGLGKTAMQLEWAAHVIEHTGGDAIILAPLAVAAQTVAEGLRLGITVTECRDAKDVRPGINITNYERLHRFDPSMFAAVVLDESSIIKHHDAKTLGILLDAFSRTPWRLCATATPSPNDYSELGTHAEFLGICTRAEMLSEFFTHDGGETQKWRLKKHARSEYWRWVASWGALVQKPSDLGYPDDGYDLPPYTVNQHVIAADQDEVFASGQLFAFEAQTMMERKQARKASVDGRVAAVAELIKSEWSKLESDGNSTGIHEPVLPGEPGEVQTNARAGGETERSQARTVRERGGTSGVNQGSGESVEPGEPGEEESREIESVRDSDVGLRGSDGDTEPTMRDLRVGRGRRQESLPIGGSQPSDGDGSGAALHELQSGHREVPRRSQSVNGGGGVPLQPWLIWCELNAEQHAMEKQFGDLAFSVEGSQTIEQKEAAIRGWLRRERPVMISKPSIMGFGLNFQHCANMAFVGVTDSWEAYYQAVRRCWRFGQTKPVEVHVFSSEMEGAVVANLARKEKDAQIMSAELSAATRDVVRETVTGSSRQSNEYNPTLEMEIPTWLQSWTNPSPTDSLSTTATPLK